MQILGIYLKDGDSRVIKNLTHGWYPFGKISDCSNVFNNEGNINEINYSKIVNEIKNNQKFVNKLYEIKPNKKNNIEIKKPYINLNCIVGKNGSGKSSIVSLEYRIINNLTCIIKHYCPLISSDYKLTWATGFNADLYYELDNEIYCISIFDNKDFEFTELQAYGIEKVRFFGKNLNFKEICKKLDQINNNFNPSIDKLDVAFMQEEKLHKYYEEIDEHLKELSKHLFYTIGINYSLYSNSVVYDTWSNKKEKWLSNIYHKNDAYFTPIVLVPYKYNGSEVNVDKELKLAKERISTLSLLLFSENKADFIENLIPSSIEYSLINESEYDFEIKKKYVHSFSKELYSDEAASINKNYDKVRKEYNLDKIIPIIKLNWENTLFSEDKEIRYKEIIDDGNLHIYNIIKNNTIKYLVYKTIKICVLYDDYKKYFGDKGFVELSKSRSPIFKTKIQFIISKFLKTDVHLDFINLKIMQCIRFLDNLDFYINKSKHIENSNSNDIFHRYVFSNDFIKTFSTAKNYDNVFINLPPSIFRKEFFYKEKKYRNRENRINERSQAVLSSGESQMLNSLSYAVYHMKNAASNQDADGRIQYKNFNIILDEAELYYHPEYQQKFIKDLLGIIGRSNLGSIVDSINITLITHSPFMLSDISKNQILALKNGKSYCIEENTLGANFYDLLKNQFFIESPIGSVIEEKIINIINDRIDYENKEEKHEEILNSYKITKDFYQIIESLLGDDFFRKNIKETINFYEREIKKCEE